MAESTIIHDDCMVAMREIEDSSIDAIVTDPPYGLGFMGKQWDTLPPGQPWAEECLRVLKPGGHLLSFGGTRTWHRLAVAVEDAGFDIRDSIAWLYGSGFPKSLDVSKAIDKAAGAEREVVGLNLNARPNSGRTGGIMGEAIGAVYNTERTAPATPDAERWQGWGTALKPAFEPIVVARKPLPGTVAANVLAHGTGALNVDGCRINWPDGKVPEIGTPGWGGPAKKLTAAPGTDGETVERRPPNAAGRWPANVLLDGSQAKALDEQSGTLKSGDVAGSKRNTEGGNGVTHGAMSGVVGASYADQGGASRFFPVFKYQAKAPTRERPKVDDVAHPTVKPLELMRWLVRLVTPPGGLVLDPFAGSGTTIEAALLEGFNIIGIEREESYLPLIQVRIGRVNEKNAT